MDIPGSEQKSEGTDNSISQPKPPRLPAGVGNKGEPESFAKKMLQQNLRQGSAWKYQVRGRSGIERGTEMTFHLISFNFN